MDVDAGDHGEKRIPFPAVDPHIMQMIVIQNTVIYPLRTGAAVVDPPVLFRTPGNGGIEPHIPGGLRIDAAPIGRRGAGFIEGTALYFLTGSGTAPFTSAAPGTETVVDHAQASLAEGGAVRVDGNGIGNGLWPAPVVIEVNKRLDIPAGAELVSRIIVMDGIQTEVPDPDMGIEGTEFGERDKDTDTVIAPGIQEADMEREIDLAAFIIKRKHVEGIAEEVAFQVAVPAPVGIRIGVMAVAGAGRDAGPSAGTYPVAIGVGVGMDTGAVTGDGNAIRGDETGPAGGFYSSDPEDLLEESFIMEREIPAGESGISHDPGDTGMAVGKFFPFRGFFWFPVLPFWKEILAAKLLEVLFQEPETVHKIKI